MYPSNCFVLFQLVFEPNATQTFLKMDSQAVGQLVIAVGVLMPNVK